jgi:hypothetical protein
MKKTVVLELKAAKAALPGPCKFCKKTITKHDDPNKVGFEEKKRKYILFHNECFIEHIKGKGIKARRNNQ